MTFVLRLPGSVQRTLEAAAEALLNPPGSLVDFARPLGEPALLPPDSQSWRLFKNPVALFVGGVAAVILELSEPAVRTGVWEHSSFRRDPLGRLRRTGLAAMVTVYGPCSVAKPMIAGIATRHARVAGRTPAGVPYAASDERLLTWVHTTAAFGFAEAYSRWVARLSPTEFDAVYREGAPASKLYGALSAPRSRADAQGLFDSLRGRLEPSPIVFDFLRIMRAAPVLPAPLKWLQRLLLGAAVETLPDWIRECHGLTDHYGLRTHERSLVRLAGSLADRTLLPAGPAAQSCLRLGLPAAHLYG